jgi:Asp/Glu/hydantoin racemase
MIARDPDGAIAILADAARDAARDGAGVVVLGGAGLAGLAPRVAPLVTVPVLDSLDCALAAALGGAPRATPRARQAPQSGLAPALERLLAAVP